VPTRHQGCEAAVPSITADQQNQLGSVPYQHLDHLIRLINMTHVHHSTQLNARVAVVVILAAVLLH
jgi:hypothetical protein